MKIKILKMKNKHKNKPKIASSSIHPHHQYHSRINNAEQQQPEPYQSEEIFSNQQGSTITCKSQHIKKTTSKITPQYHPPCCLKNTQTQSKITLNNAQNAQFIMSDNKKTRKVITNHIEDSSNFKQDKPFLKNPSKFSKTPIEQHNNNEQTLRRNLKPCPHKPKSKSKLISHSLTHIGNRLLVCQNFIERNQQITHKLVQQVDFLLKKQQQRHERKLKSKQAQQKHKNTHSKHHKLYKNDKHQDYGFLQDVLETQNLKKILNNPIQSIQSLGRFHYRSCDNKSSKQKIKSLIYFHDQNPKHPYHNKSPSIQKSSKITNFRPQKSNGLIYSNIKKTSPKIQNYSHSIDQVYDISYDQVKKSRKKPYEDNSEYLLEEYEDDTLRETKNKYKTSHTYDHFQQFSSGKLDFPYAQSERVITSGHIHSNSENQYFNSIQSRQHSPSHHTKYLTKEFHASQEKNCYGPTPKRLSYSNFSNEQSRISNQSSIKSSRNRKIGHFTQGSRVEITQEACQSRSKASKSKQHQSKNKLEGSKLNSNQNSSSKSGQESSQKHYTFINHEENNKNSSLLLSNFEIIESNFNSANISDAYSSSKH